MCFPYGGKRVYSGWGHHACVWSPVQDQVSLHALSHNIWHGVLIRPVDTRWASECRPTLPTQRFSIHTSTGLVLFIHTISWWMSRLPCQTGNTSYVLIWMYVCWTDKSILETGSCCPMASKIQGILRLVGGRCSEWVGVPRRRRRSRKNHTSLRRPRVIGAQEGYHKTIHFESHTRSRAYSELQ